MNGSIEKRTDRRSPWRARYYKPNGDQASRSFRTQQEAQRWLRAEIGKLDTGTWVDPNDGTTE